MPAGLVALGDDDVDARLHVAQGLLGATDEGGHLHVLGVGPLDGFGGRRSEGAGQELDGMGQCDVDER